MAVLPNTRWRDKSIKVTSNNDVQMDETLNGSVIRKNRGYQMFEFEGETLITSQVESKSLYAFLVSHSITGESFKVRIPSGLQCLTQSHARSANILKPVEAGETTLQYKATGVAPVGCHFNFTNHNKLYVIKSVEGDVITFQPELRVDVDTSVQMDFEPTIYGFMKNKKFELEPEAGNYQQFKIKIQEDI